MNVMTQHASIRKKQRGIKEKTLDCLFKYGAKEHDKRGCLILYFNKHSKHQMRKDLSPHSSFKSIEPQLDAYAVVALTGEVLTVGRRVKKITKH